MDWVQVIVILIAIFGTFCWQRAEAMSDMRHFESEIRNSTQAFKNEIRGWKSDIDKEMKDFHGRLCSIEERRGK